MYHGHADSLWMGEGSSSRSTRVCTMWFSMRYRAEIYWVRGDTASGVSGCRCVVSARS
jgi:hypothetical protein